jgi:hypothetical protein
MKTIFIFLLAVFAANDLVAQGHYTDWWHFGNRAGVHFTQTGVEPFYDSQLKSSEACVSMSDSSGNLLFYSDGYHIWNVLNEVMPHGDSLHAQVLFDWMTQPTIDSFGNSSTDGVIAIPRPTYSNQYYIFSHVQGCFTGNTGSCLDGLIYQLVDMTQEGGLGDVIVRNTYIDSAQRRFCEKLAACKHANGRDWWLVSHEYNNNKFLAWLISPDSIIGPYLTPIGSVQTNDMGEICFNQQGTLLGLANESGLVEIVHFDRCNGEFSNALTLNPTATGGPISEFIYFGCEFSPSGVMFYSGNGDSIYQWDLTNESNIIETAIASLPLPFTEIGTDTSHFTGQMQLGPDGKLYFKCAPAWGGYPMWYIADSYFTSLAIINTPDVSGLGCDLQFNAVSHYPRIGWLGLPNLPNYNLGALEGSPCDTIPENPDLVPPKEQASRYPPPFNVYPNPGTDYFYCSYSTELHQAVIEVYDAIGRKVLSENAQHGSTKVSTSEGAGKSLAAGVYTIKIVSENKETAVAKWVKVE